MHWHTIGNILYVMFVWPGGIVVGNLIASALWEWPSQIIHAIRTHKQNKAQTEHIKKHINSVATQATVAAVEDEPVRL